MRKITIYENRKKKIVSLTNREVEIIKESPSFVKIKNDLTVRTERNLMSAMYFKQAFWIDLLILAFASFMTTIALDYFISSTGKTGIFPGGLGSISRFLALVTFPSSPTRQSSFYFVYYLLLNLPLIGFALWKLGLRFTLTTLLYILFSIGFDNILAIIPVINPQEWHVIINYQLIHAIPGEWNSAIWLFVFAIFGGALLGWSYAITYKIGSSTGGQDFLTVYYSTKKNKNIGSINRNLNFIILSIVIICNTFMLKGSEIGDPIRYSVLSNASLDQLDQIKDAAKTWWDVYAPLNNLPEFQTMWDNNREELLRTLAAHSSFNGYTHSMVLLMQFKFILGPSLFASIVLVIVQSLVINAVYPKYNFRTIMITTSKSETVKKFLFQSGYRNEVFEWAASVESSRQQFDKKILTITITVINWETLEKAILALDPDMNVNVLRTRSVKGELNIDLKDNRKEQFVHNKLLANKELLKKIDDEALIRTIERNYKIDTKNRPSKK